MNIFIICLMALSSTLNAQTMMQGQKPDKDVEQKMEDKKKAAGIVKADPKQWQELTLASLNPKETMLDMGEIYKDARLSNRLDNMDYGLDLTVVLIRGSIWEADNMADLKHHVKRVAEDYSQCRIKVKSCKVIQIDPPLGNKDYTALLPDTWETQFAMFIQKHYKTKPIVFLLNSKIKGLYGHGFFDGQAETTSGGPYSEGESGSWSGGDKNVDCAMAGTVWLWKQNRDDEVISNVIEKTAYNKRLDILVHELAHVLGDVQTYTNKEGTTTSPRSPATGKCYGIKKQRTLYRFIEPKDLRLVLSHSEENEQGLMVKQQCEDFTGANCRKGEEAYCSRYVKPLSDKVSADRGTVNLRGHR